MIVYWPWFFIFFAYGISLVLRNSMVIEIKIAYTTFMDHYDAYFGGISNSFPENLFHLNDN